MKTNENIKEVLITSQQIAARVHELGEQISADYRGKTPLVVGILKGSSVFFADLIRQMEIDVNINFVTLSSYGSGTESSGTVRVLGETGVDFSGRDVLVVEDIVDSGLTMSYFIKTVKERGAKSVAVCTLLSKPSRRKVDVPLAYIGFEIPDKFVIGYGMDFDERYRNLVDVCVLKEEAYS